MWFVWGVLPALFCEFFPTHLRYTGISLGNQAATIIGGFVPLFATAVVARAGTWPVSVLIIVCEMLALIALLPMNKEKNRAKTVEKAPAAL